MKRADLIDSVLAGGEKSSYTFIFEAGPPDENGKRTRYTVVARPKEFGKTGDRNFFTDETGVIRSTSENRPATKDDSPLK